ncbi:proton-conducting transporter transmembrane domain-containing protein [Oryzibacter oryziterrae]|uniref:proton-conducting transporter transmembrane domain-containing protein n=1 Tax=Oryzibacter oryziterrae TaxID=2766474 RepID=UPI001F47B17A|nr:proton-conducting transporter membrane subunit [Oryzibacter oryziterrae]
MLSPSTIDPMAMAWMGAIFLLFGEIAALLSLPNLARVVVVSTIAEVGYVLIGLGIGGDAGLAGAYMHLGYQLVMRGLVVAAGWYLISRTGSSKLNDLAGSGQRMPVAATLFGFGMFSVMGLSPFKGSFSKFLILYAAIEQGHWAIAAVGTLATIVSAVYYMLVIQRVCLEHAPRRIELQPASNVALMIAAALALVTALISVWPLPFQHMAERFAGVVAAGTVPEFESPWATLVLVPYIGAFALYLIGRVSPKGRDVAAVLLAIATLALVVTDSSLDPLSRVFALVFTGITAVMILYSVGYMARAEWSNRYYFFAFLMIGSLLGLTTAHEFGNFYVYWELMTWTSYFLVIHEQTQKSLRAGLIYFLMCAGGAYVMHFGILLTHVQVGSFEFAVLANKIGTVSPLAGLVIAVCFFIGFAVKAGIFPLHSWLPIAHPAAPSSISGPLSGILTKAGVFGLIKVLMVIIGADALSRFTGFGIGLNVVLMALGVVTLLYGEIRALYETEIKRMLAFSTLAQVGEIVAILGIGTALATDASLLHVTNHAVMKTLLFFAAGAFIMQTGRRNIADLAGVGRVMPFTAGCYALATVSIMGLPPFSGFTSKFLMIYAAADAGHYEIAAALLLGGIIAVIYYLRVVGMLFFRPWKGEAGVKEAPLSMLVAVGVLGLAIVAGGFFPAWQLDLVGRVGDVIAARNGLAAVSLPSLVMAWPASAAIAFAGAVASWLVGRKSVAWAGRIAVASLVLATLAVIGDAPRYDTLSFWFAVLIAGVGALNMLHATAYLAHNHAQPRFFAAFGIMIAGLLGMTAAKDIFSFFGFWELMSSWALWTAIVHEENEEARREGFKYFFFNTVGASFMFLGVATLAASAGTFDLVEVGQKALTMPIGALSIGLVLTFLGLVMKAAMLPVRIDVQMHPALAPTPVSGYISAVLLKSGPWGVLKLFTLFGGAAVFARIGGDIGGQPALMDIIAVIAGITVVYAGAMAVLQNGIKLLLIYSTVSQLGYVLMALSLGTSLGVAGGLMHFVNHMLLKDTLFLVAGAVMVKSHASMLDELGGLGRRMPITFGFFLFAGLSLAGIPPLNGFASKWMIFSAAFESGHWALGAGAMISSLFTLAAVLKFAHAAFMGAPTAKALQAEEAPLSMLIPMGILVGASVIIGVMPGLLLVPIAQIEAELGLTPIAASLTGPLPGTGGWNPALLWILVLLVGAAFMPWMRLIHRGAGIKRGGLHLSGATPADFAPEVSGRVGAHNLFESPTAVIRGLLTPKIGKAKQH